MVTWKEAEARFKAVDPKFKAWTDAQNDAYQLWETLDNQRMLLFYPTGKGKTKTSLSLLASRGYEKIVVIAPPKTHDSWKWDAAVLELELVIMSIEKFRQPTTKLPKDTPVIVDEFHLTGKHNGVGFKKLDRMAQYFPAIILASATPQYNDADRVYCIAHVLDPINNKGGYLQWIYEHCETTVNPFATTPYVDGFRKYSSPADWLLAAGYTAYIEDTAEWIPEDWPVRSPWQRNWFDDYGYDQSQHRLIASQMEASHREAYLLWVNAGLERLWDSVTLQLEAKLQESPKPWLLFCQHSTIAEAVYRSLQDSGWETYLITGRTSERDVEAQKNGFINSASPQRVLIGTSALATGVDGIDKVCDQLLILDDIVGDDSKRRQLIGRVLPRGTEERETLVITAAITSIDGSFD